jgi:hypothetical protein
MERTGRVLMRSIARSLGLAEGFFDPYFEGGISTLRLIRYPVRPPASMIGVPEDRLWVTHRGLRHYLLGRAHVDSGLMTLLAQDGVAGLQARAGDGTWVDVPPEEARSRSLGGAVGDRRLHQGTEHRVIGGGMYSIISSTTPGRCLIELCCPARGYAAPFRGLTVVDHDQVRRARALRACVASLPR